MILTDEQIKAALDKTVACLEDRDILYSRAIEAAVLAALPGEPVAFAVLADSGNAIQIWWSGAERERAERISAEDFPGKRFVALYAYPPDTEALIRQARKAERERVAKWIEPQRNDIPATGAEFAAAIRQMED